MNANDVMSFWGAPGEFLLTNTFTRPVVWGPHEVGGAEPGPQRHFNSGAPAESLQVNSPKRPMVWGPHEVGGAEPGAERLYNE